jgi:uncharacterized membrane protein SpoIIM required for sporulation
MKEVVFIKRNIDRWNHFEKLIEKKTEGDPDVLASMFIQITDDLAYSRTFYPKSDTSRYLNHLAAKTHLKIYKNKKEDRNIVKKFWKTDFPLLIYRYHRFIRISFVIFVVAAIIGAFSAANDVNFVRLILGDDYVDMTLNNIKKGDPMAVYKQALQTEMFVGITINNIGVSFKAFIYGVFVAIGTLLVLLYNGIMLGSFQYFFYEFGLLKESALTIWIHGTLEIFSIIVAGAAGLILGSSILFPESYSRARSFKRGAKDGIQIVLGLMPIFIVAGFLESFITRYTQAPDFIRLGIILASLLFIFWYFIVYPVQLAKKTDQYQPTRFSDFILSTISILSLKKEKNANFTIKL